MSFLRPHVYTVCMSVHGSQLCSLSLYYTIMFTLTIVRQLHVQQLQALNTVASYLQANFVFSLQKVVICKQKHLGCKKARPIRSSSYLTTATKLYMKSKTLISVSFLQAKSLLAISSQLHNLEQVTIYLTSQLAIFNLLFRVCHLQLSAL